MTGEHIDSLFVKVNSSSFLSPFARFIVTFCIIMFADSRGGCGISRGVRGRTPKVYPFSLAVIYPNFCNAVRRVDFRAGLEASRQEGDVSRLLQDLRVGAREPATESSNNP